MRLQRTMGRGLALSASLWLGASACAHESGSRVQDAPPVSASARPDAAPAPALVVQLADGARLLPGLGTHHRDVTTTKDEAQAFFDQGLRLTFAFNHDEAARSFAQAAVLDPGCGMCFWGAALTLGPNYNVPMLAERAETAWVALQAARQAVEDDSPVEQALVAALAARYGGPEYLEPAEMQPYTEAYAAAMREVAARFPEDDDIQVLFAEAMMNVRPWKLWTTEGQPEPGTEALVAALETVLARSPAHPGANHYYIHAIEASIDPGRALPSADRLAALMPGAGHVVHMPAHIYQRVGRYADASRANRAAIEADERYLAATDPPGYYPLYVAHNHGFLAYSASMQGRRAESLAAARRSSETMPRGVVCGMPGMDFFLAEPLLVMVRFGMWPELLAEPAPDAAYPILTALYHHARGMALASTGDLRGAEAEHEALEALSAELPEEMFAGLNSGREVLALAAKVLEARIAERRRRPNAAALYAQAVGLEDGLSYNEPADWFYPVRHLLGALLLDRGRAAEAVAVFQADLERNPDNGWALYGLARALRDDGRHAEAAEAENRFARAFEASDIDLQRPAY